MRSLPLAFLLLLSFLPAHAQLKGVIYGHGESQKEAIVGAKIKSLKSNS